MSTSLLNRNKHRWRIYWFL